jgi:hypothetical protein
MHSRLLAAAVALALAASARAQTQEPAPSPPATPAPPEPAPQTPRGAPAPTPGAEAGALPLGVILSVDVGGGGRLGGGSEFTPRGVFEAELTAGYDVAAGFRPELAVLAGVSPHGYAGLRLGFRYTLPDTPFYARAAIDGSTVRGPASWRWLLAGGGAEVRLTDVLGAFAGADLGLPLTSGSGVPILVRAGVSFRL